MNYTAKAIACFYVGIGLYYLLGALYCLMMERIFGCEMLTSQDLVWMRNGE